MCLWVKQFIVINTVKAINKNANLIPSLLEANKNIVESPVFASPSG